MVLMYHMVKYWTNDGVNFFLKIQKQNNWKWMLVDIWVRSWRKTQGRGPTTDLCPLTTVWPLSPHSRQVMDTLVVE